MSLQRVSRCQQGPWGAVREVSFLLVQCVFAGFLSAAFLEAPAVCFGSTRSILEGTHSVFGGQSQCVSVGPCGMLGGSLQRVPGIFSRCFAVFLESSRPIYGSPQCIFCGFPERVLGLSATKSFAGLWEVKSDLRSGCNWFLRQHS